MKRYRCVSLMAALCSGLDPSIPIKGASHARAEEGCIRSVRRSGACIRSDPARGGAGSRLLRASPWVGMGARLRLAWSSRGSGDIADRPRFRRGDGRGGRGGRGAGADLPDLPDPTYPAQPAYAPPPTYYPPQPAYASPPGYYAPAAAYAPPPAYYAPPPAYYPRAPAYYPAPRTYYAPPPVYYRPYAGRSHYGGGGYAHPNR